MRIPQTQASLHVMAFLTVAVWGTTFVSTKVLIGEGLSPLSIFLLRFSVAYAVMLAFVLTGSRRRRFMLRAASWRDELLMVLLGVTGGSLYFFTENEALRHTTATNTSLIVCSCPLLAAAIIRVFYREERLGIGRVLGSLVAMAGMAVVVLNGHFVLKLSPLGDSLAMAACLSWALYSLLLRGVAGRYTPLFLTRKVFFYGILTALPYFFLSGERMAPEVLLKPEVAWNVMFLGCVASMLCYLTWSYVAERLGAVRCTNWVYCNPLTTIVFSWLVLDEAITPYFMAGAALIVSGMFIANYNDNKKL